MDRDEVRALDEGRKRDRLERAKAVAAALVLTLSLGPAVGEPSTKRVEDEKKAASADWPRWRGPNADGVAEGGKLPLSWSKTENVLWSAKLPGWGTSSPVVHGGRVFITSQDTQDGKKTLLTL